MVEKAPGIPGAFSLPHVPGRYFALACPLVFPGPSRHAPVLRAPGTHGVQHRLERAADGAQLVDDTDGAPGVDVPDDDAVLVEGAKSGAQHLLADAAKGGLKLAEAHGPGGKLLEDEEFPLAPDDMDGDGNGALRQTVLSVHGLLRAGVGVWRSRRDNVMAW